MSQFVRARKWIYNLLHERKARKKSSKNSPQHLLLSSFQPLGRKRTRERGEREEREERKEHDGDGCWKMFVLFLPCDHFFLLYPTSSPLLPEETQYIMQDRTSLKPRGKKEREGEGKWKREKKEKEERAKEQESPGTPCSSPLFRLMLLFPLPLSLSHSHSCSYCSKM